MKHPLEELFGMPEGTTVKNADAFDSESFDIEKEYDLTVPQQNAVATTEAPPDVKDADDIETERKIDEVYNSAMTTFQNQIAYTEIIEPKFAARNAEVAANYLSIALQAAATKAKVKTDRRRNNAAFIPYANGGKTTNNIIMADRNEILKMITIDAEKKALE